MTRMRRRLQSAFTLIELVMVIVMIGILSGIAIPLFMDYRTQARHQALVTTAASISANANRNYTLRKRGAGVAVASCADAGALASFDTAMAVSGASALSSGTLGVCTLNYIGFPASEAITFSAMGA